MTCLSLLCVIALAAAGTPTDDDQLVAIAEDLELSRADFGAWLVERTGLDHVQDYLVEMLALREVEQRGIAPTDDEVDATWTVERDLIVKEYFRGDIERYENDIRARGEDPAMRAHRRKLAIRFEMSLAALARLHRVITEDELRARFRDVFGELGERVTVDVLFYSAYRDVKPGSRPDIAALKTAAGHRAASAENALRSGTSVAALLPESDPVQSTFVKDGRVEAYRRNLLGPDVELALASLDAPGDVSPVIAVWDGHYVLQLVERKPVAFEDVQDELRAMINQTQPNAAELGDARARLLEEHGGEVLMR